MADELVVVIPEEETEEMKGNLARRSTDHMERWAPRTELGRKVKSGEIRDINEVLDSGKKILEAEIVDILVPNLETDLLLIGQAKGKFGGGKRRVFRQTQKKTAEGNKPSFATIAVVGNKDGMVGIGYGKARETVPAREKAIRNAKLAIVKVRRGCGSWRCGCREPHTIPFVVEGSVGSVVVTLIPAPKGTGLAVGSDCKKVLALAGINDIWSKTRGQTRSRLNMINALFSAVKQLSMIKVQPVHTERLGLVEGATGKKNETVEHVASGRPEQRRRGNANRKRENRGRVERK